jgi:hypothetical protein
MPNIYKKKLSYIKLNKDIIKKYLVIIFKYIFDILYLMITIIYCYYYI